MPCYADTIVTGIINARSMTVRVALADRTHLPHISVDRLTERDRRMVIAQKQCIQVTDKQLNCVV
jgi:hypothetical protein